VPEQTTDRADFSTWDHLCGWLLFLGGFAVLGAAILLPSWRTARQLAAQRSVLRLQAEHLASQQEAYGRFHEALAQRHPVLLQRLAFGHLGLKPVGTEMLGDRYGRSPDGDHSSTHAAVALAPADASVGAWLHRPLPPDAARIEGPIGSLVVPDAGSRLGGLPFGAGRVSAMAIGTLALVIGLLMPLGKIGDSQ